MVKNPSANAGDTRDAGLIPGSRRFLGGGNGNPLQYSCLGNAMDRGVWWAMGSMGLQRVEHELVTEHVHKSLCEHKHSSSGRLSFLFWGAVPRPCGILVSQPGIKPMSSAVYY